MQDPLNLAVYHRAMDLAERVYGLARRIPARQFPGVTSQLQRSAWSIPSNIAEGAGQSSRAVFARHLAIAIGSGFELETHLRLAARIAKREREVEGVIEEVRAVRRMLHRLREYQIGGRGHREIRERSDGEREADEVPLPASGPSAS